jgi:hypothetical protein
MVWLMERNSDLLVCEIRHAPEGQAYEFEVASRSGVPETRQYTSARALIEEYLRTQTTLQAQGWRPKATEVASL